MKASRPASRLSTSWPLCWSGTRHLSWTCGTGMPDRKPDAPKAPPIEYRLGALRWPVMRRLGVHPSGEERLRGLGAGLDFSDAGEYVTGCDSLRVELCVIIRFGPAI